MKWLLPASMLLIAASGCRDTTLVPPRSLDSPSAMAVARGNVCLSTFEDTDRVVQYEIGACAEGDRGAIALITNEQSDRLALMDLNAPVPRLVDLDPASPGPNHLEVGRLPVDVAASPDGTVAYTLNQLDRDVSIIDLYTPSTLTTRYSVDETPIALDVDPASGEVLVAAGSPSKLYGFAGVSMCGPGEFCPESPDPAEVEPRVVELPGTVSGMVAAPGGDEVWVVYRDLSFATVVSFGETPEGFDTPCLSGSDAKPCVVANVSLTYECGDGLDNDGDGQVDQQDIQCFGPLGSESPGGLGRLATDACANGLDDDEDGLADRDDPDCRFASGIDEGVAPTPVLATCADGIDNDGDGNLDYPADSECYGLAGRTEESVRPLGFDAIGVDPQGVFVYVTDRAQEQVLVVDGRRKRLIDAPASELPRADMFDAGLGIDVAPSPLSIQGAIDRSVLWVDEGDSDHVVMRYDFGAWVSTNNGTIQYVDTAVSFCEFTGPQVDDSAFWRGEQSEEETNCLTMPTFPLQSATARVVAGDDALPAACLEQDFLDCATCREGGELNCEACIPYADTQFELCQRAFAEGTTTRYVNARFALRDGGGDDGRLLGSGTCEQPDSLVAAMQQYASNNPSGPQDLKCNSLLMPQPLADDAAELAIDDIDALRDLGRATLFELRTLQFDTENGNTPIVGFRPSDNRILNEGITTTFEGIVPGTQRSDAVLAAAVEEDGSVWVDVGFDPCTRGLEVGDHFIVTNETSEGCAVSEDLEYEIVEINSSEIRIAPLEGFADLPSRDCFETGFSYEIRATDEWVVVGESSGFFSPNESKSGVCVPRYGYENLSSRVSTGELYVGPYYSFFLYPGVSGGEIEEVRDMSTTFQVTSGFSSVQFPTCSSVGTQCAAGLFPTQVLWVPGLPGGTLLLSPDPNDEFIHIRNLADSSAVYAVVR